MPLELRPVEAADFDVMSRYMFREGGDLIAPLVPIIWPTSDDDAANTKRNNWSLQRQKDIFYQDPTVKFLQVVDTDRDDEIISLARWHYYPEGFKPDTMLAWELNGTHPDADENWPQKINVPLAKAVLISIVTARPGWMGKEPQWGEDRYAFCREERKDSLIYMKSSDHAHHQGATAQERRRHHVGRMGRAASKKAGCAGVLGSNARWSSGV